MPKEISIEEKLEVIHADRPEKDRVLTILLDLQNLSSDGYIDQETTQLVADELKMTETQVFELISFYSMLKYKPQAKFVLKLCDSSPCHFSSTNMLVSSLEKKLGIGLNEMTADGMFSYHFIPCFGACDISPAIKIRDTVYGNLDEEKVNQLIDDLYNEKL